MCNAQRYLQDCNDNMYSHNGWLLPMPSKYSYYVPPIGPPFDPWIAPIAPSGTYQQSSDPLDDLLYTNEDIFGASSDQPQE